MGDPTNQPQRRPGYLEGILGSVVPLAAAVVVASVAGFLIYIFWFGADWLMNWLF